MKKIAYIILLLAAIATLAIGIDAMGPPYTMIALGFILWAISPYVFWAAMIKLVTNKSAIITALGVTILVSILGVGLIFDIMYIHPDAQGGLVLLFTPLWQWLGLLVVSLPLFILNKAKKAP